MKRFRLQLVGVLILVALLPALPAAWTAHNLLDRILNPLLDARIDEGARAGLASTRDLLREEMRRFEADLRRGDLRDSLGASQWARLDPREQASLRALADAAPAAQRARMRDGGGSAAPPRSPAGVASEGGPVLVPPQRMTLGGRDALVALVGAGGGRRLWLARPVPGPLAERAQLLSAGIRLVETMRRERGALLRSLLLTFLIVYGGILILALVTGLVLASRITRPVTSLAAGIRSVAAGHLETRVPETGAGEMRALLESFNTMASRLRLQQEQLLRLEKLGAWRQMARKLAHEIKNPLTPIQLAAQQMRDAYAGEDAKYRELLNEGAAIVEEEVGSLRALVNEFSQFARLPEPRMAAVSLADILADIQNLYGPEGVSVAPADARGARLSCDREQVHRILINLINNAREAQAGAGVSGPVELRTSCAPGEGTVRISVADRGPGVALDLRPRIFEPDFTTKSGGMGLGLAIAAGAVEAHGGRLEVAERDGGGAIFSFALPLASREVEHEAENPHRRR